jgi:hypothetical protein
VPPAQRSFPSGFAGSLRSMMSVAAKTFQMIGLLWPAGRGRDLKATVAENCNRDRADAAGGAGHQHRRAHGGSGRRQSRHRLLDDRQIDHRRQKAEQDREPPDRVVGAGALEQHAAQPHAEEAANLMAEEGKAEQHG